jgi:hypothetical protein
MKHFFFLLLFLAFAFGWVMNLIKLFELDGMSGELVVRTIGIVVIPLLRVIIGYVQ